MPITNKAQAFAYAVLVVLLAITPVAALGFLATAS
jgi:hypothetical protein